MAYARSNPHRFTTTRAGKAEIDEEFNTQTGWINDTSRRLDTIEISGISGANNPANAGKVPVTNGYQISWKKVDLTYLTPQSMNDTILQDRSITNRVMGVHSIGADQLIDGCINEYKVLDNSLPGFKIREESLSGTKIVDHSLAFNKLNTAQSDCLVAGSPGNNHYDCQLDPWTIATVQQAGQGPVKTLLNTVWNNTAAPFDGRRIADNSLPGNCLQHQTVTAAQIAPQSLNGSVFAPNTVSGSIIQDGTLPTSKLNCAGGIGLVSAAGFYDGVLNLIKSYNIHSVIRVSPGVYRISFATTMAPDRHYIVLATPHTYTRTDPNPLAAFGMGPSTVVHQSLISVSPIDHTTFEVTTRVAPQFTPFDTAFYFAVYF